MLISPTTKRPRTLEDLIEPRLLARLDRFDIKSRKMFPGKLLGERRSKKRGQSVEFDDYRTYVPGDDLRFIDWNVYARLDRLFIKLFLEEEDLALHVALDASASMDTGDPNKLIFGARLAMALGYIGLVNQNRVGFTVFGRPGAGASILADRRGRRHVSALGQFLIDSVWGGQERPQAQGGSPGRGGTFDEALTTIAKQRVGKGVMLIVSDFLLPEGYERGLRSLASAGGYDTYAVQVLSPQEIEPERAVAEGVSGDLRLTDIETGRGAEITLSAEMLRAYKARLEKYCADLRKFCVSREIDHILARSDASMESLLLDTFRRSGVLG